MHERVGPDIVAPAVVLKQAAVQAKMPLQVAPFHAACPLRFRCADVAGKGVRRADRNAFNASRAFSNASDTDSAWVQSPG